VVSEHENNGQSPQLVEKRQVSLLGRHHY
jgi:hypothetical protein